MMLTTALILLPIAGALVVAMLPLPRETTAGLAFLVALHGGRALDRRRGPFRLRRRAALQLDTSREWVESLGISYSVGFYGFSIWLTGATVIVSAAAIGYAIWVGRDRPRAYHALMLFLLGAVVATFVVAGPAPLLRLVRGDADPALRPRRRVGRRAAPGRDA